jgi:glycosyltransferase involved in cell wall biosynthesis
MKVLHIITRMNTGGPAVFLDHLTSSLVSLGCESTIAFGYCESNEIDYLETKKLSSNCIKITSLHRSLNPYHDLKSFIKIRNVIKTIKPDLINTHTSKAGVLGRLAAKSVDRDLPVAHTFHGHLIYGYFAKYKSLIFTIIEKFMSIFTDMFIAVTSETKSSLQKLGIGKKGAWQVIPIGIPIAPITTSKSDPTQPLKLLWVGRFTDIKDPFYAIETIRTLEVTKPAGFTLTMVGEGEVFEEAKKRAVGLPIKFTGWIKTPFESIKEFDLLMLTSKNEGLPLVMLEAANLGKPTISRNVGGVSEFIKSNTTGFLVSGGHQEMAKIITELAHDRNRLEQAGALSKKLLSSEFSVETMAKQYYQTYNQLMIRD